MISFCHVDNYCHGLMLGAEALYPGSPALGIYIYMFIHAFELMYSDIHIHSCIT